MKKYVLSLVIVCSVIGSTIQAQMAPNQLEEIYHQKNNHKNCLEIANILLLFSRDPQEISFMPQHTILSNGMHQLTFVFDNTSAGHNLLKRVKACMGEGYRFKIEAQDKNLVLVVIYDPKKVEVHYDRYTELDLRRGFIIRFFDHALLSCIKNKESYVLQTAAVEFLSMYVSA